MKRISCLLYAAVAAGCIQSPELRECYEFSADEGGCEVNCEVYCEAMVANCPQTFDSEAVCVADCRDEVQPSPVEGAPGDRTGNSRQCRLTYMLEGDCTEASLEQTTACRGQNACPEYCQLMVGSCADAFTNEDNCLASCATLPTAADDSDRNSQECRLKYARQAAAAAGDEALCQAASYGSDGRCGTPCETYCNLLDLHCGDNPQFASRQTCERVCQVMNSNGRYDDWLNDLDSVQCRLWHLGPPADLAPATHCKHGAVYNDEHCGLTPCDTYCQTVLDNCPDVYDDLEQCLTECPTLDEFMPMNFDPDAVYPMSSQECPTR